MGQGTHQLHCGFPLNSLLFEQGRRCPTDWRSSCNACITWCRAAGNFSLPTPRSKRLLGATPRQSAPLLFQSFFAF